MKLSYKVLLVATLVALCIADTDSSSSSSGRRKEYRGEPGSMARNCQKPRGQCQPLAQEFYDCVPQQCLYGLEMCGFKATQHCDAKQGECESKLDTSACQAGNDACRARNGESQCNQDYDQCRNGTDVQAAVAACGICNLGQSVTQAQIDQCWETWGTCWQAATGQCTASLQECHQGLELNECDEELQQCKDASGDGQCRDDAEQCKQGAEVKAALADCKQNATDCAPVDQKGCLNALLFMQEMKRKPKADVKACVTGAGGQVDAVETTANACQLSGCIGNLLGSKKAQCYLDCTFNFGCDCKHSLDGCKAPGPAQSSSGHGSGNLEFDYGRWRCLTCMNKCKRKRTIAECDAACKLAGRC